MYRDHFLGVLVSMAEDGSEIPIALNIEGKIIGGTMISGREYFEGMAREVSDTPQLQQLFSAMPGILDEAVSAGIEEGDDPEEIEAAAKTMAEAFVHMRDTYLLKEDGAFINMDKSLWRGRSEAVSGYWLGRLEMPGSEQ